MKATHVTFYLLDFDGKNQEIQNVDYCSKKQADKFLENSTSSISEYPYEIAMTMSIDEFEQYKKELNK